MSVHLFISVTARSFKTLH